jgi:hypothetical protein
MYADIQVSDLIATAKGWQTLIAAFIAIIAACIAWWNTTRQIHNTAELERLRRSRKQAALRAVLPLALSEITNYAAQTSYMLRGLLVSIMANRSAPIVIPGDPAERPQLPSSTIEVIADFIE